MKRRVAAAVSAVLLAVVGGVLLLGYVSAADQRAMAGLESTDVLVVARPVPAGTPAEHLADSVAVRRLPKVAVAPGAATSGDDLVGLVSTTALEPGEQVLRSRFVDPATLVEADEVVVPPGFQQVAVQLEPERVVGGAVTSGSRVGVFLSGDKRTVLSLREVLVTAVQGGVVSAEEEDEQGPTAAPTEAVLVTLAVVPADAQKLVSAAEHGTIWLASEPSATTTDTPKETLGS